MHGQPSADTVALPGADSRSDRFRCGGRESNFLQPPAAKAKKKQK